MMETIRNVCNPCGRANVFPMPTGFNSTPRRTQSNTPAEEKPAVTDPPSDMNTGDDETQNEVERIDDTVEEVGAYQEPEEEEVGQEPRNEETDEPGAEVEQEEIENHEDPPNENEQDER